MKLRLLVDGARTPPQQGEICLVVAEGDGNTTHLFRAKLQYFEDIGGTWLDVPIEMYSMKIEADKIREAQRLAKRKPKGE